MHRALLTCFASFALLAACSSDPAESSTAPDAASSETAIVSDTGGATNGEAAPPADTAPVAVTFDGYWVWKEIVEGGTVTRTITDADMTWKVGPMGWEGCPTGISCTKYGIDVLYVSPTRFHHMNRVTTGSDYQKYGSYTVSGDIITFNQAQTYSCAHPKDPAEYVKPATLYARFKKVDGDLWLTPFADKDPGAGAAKWTVYRTISKADAHNKYDHPFCGEMREGGTCHCLCPSQDVLADYTCAK